MPRFRPMFAALAALTLCAALFASGAAALQECRLMRQPDIQGDRIVFLYGGDLWVVARAGGLGVRITSHEGQELFPKFSPDGRTIAFTGEYDGNLDAYTVPTDGGEPKRLTWYPAGNQVMEWYPDGKALLIRSRRTGVRTDRFFRVPTQGGFEEQLPLPSGGYATFSADGMLAPKAIEYAELALIVEGIDLAGASRRPRWLPGRGA